MAYLYHQHYNSLESINHSATSVSSAIEASESFDGNNAPSLQKASIREVVIWDRKAEGGFPGMSI